MLEGESSQIEGSMVGLTSSHGVILATNSKDYEIYLLDDRIYCCAPRAGIDRRIVLEVSAQVDHLTRDRGQKMTVSRVRDMLCGKYECVDAADVLLAGQDNMGLHLYSLQERGASRRVIYAAKGRYSEDIVSFLTHNWKESLNLNEAEQLARKSLKWEHSEMCTIYRAREIEDQDAIVDFDADDMSSQSPNTIF
ncbi:uncharacterized protein LOC6531789 [Drosophila yakuba]|nr:uncharacterized protein LOC6531789 [Drosophila yakuba]KRK00449.1 uncharacterized protein Dyak_GE11593, isoform B [Drosophila yakuba]